MVQTKRKQKRINFDEDNLDLFNYLESKGNASDYMRELLRKDYEASKTKTAKEDQILASIKRVEEKLNQFQISKEPMSEEVEYKPSEDEVENLMGW